MGRTTRRKKTERNKKQADVAGGEGATLMDGFAAGGLTDEGANVVVQLTECALLGHPTSYGALTEIKETDAGEGPGANPMGFSQAMAWKEEPEWQGESSEAEAETATGSREPENQFI